MTNRLVFSGSKFLLAAQDLTALGFALIAGLALVGCPSSDGQSSSCAVGAEGCPCSAGGGCDPGLTCLSETCVQQPGDTTTSGGLATATGGREDQNSTGDDGGPPPATGGSEPGAPEIVSLQANVEQISPGELAVLSAIVTDPDGIDDVIGGQLKTEDGSAVYGTFQTSAQEGAYSLELSFDDIVQVVPVGVQAAPVTRMFRAEFFDQSGSVSWRAITIDLGCDAETAVFCGNACSPGECHPLAVPCAEGHCGLNPSTNLWECIPALDMLQIGEPCSSNDECAPGLLCVDGLDLPSCFGPSCCTPICDSSTACPIPTFCEVVAPEDDDAFACGELGACLFE